jgi:hypothetical protein
LLLLLVVVLLLGVVLLLLLLLWLLPPFLRGLLPEGRDGRGGERGPLTAAPFGPCPAAGRRFSGEGIFLRCKRAAWWLACARTS